MSTENVEKETSKPCIQKCPTCGFTWVKIGDGKQLSAKHDCKITLQKENARLRSLLEDNGIVTGVVKSASEAKHDIRAMKQRLEEMKKTQDRANANAKRMETLMLEIEAKNDNLKFFANKTTILLYCLYCFAAGIDCGKPMPIDRLMEDVQHWIETNGQKITIDRWKSLGEEER